jgi:release factor glutamine methyltransferase
MRIVAPPGVFRPRSDSWMLAEIVQEEVLPGSSVLDLCTGSGAVAIAAALGGAGDVTAIDVSRRSQLTVRLNAALNGTQVRTLRGDLFAPVAGRRFDVIATNPPYLPSAPENDGELPARGPSRAWEGGDDGRAFVDRIVAEAPAHLRPGGSLWMVHSSVCGTERTLEAMAAAGLDPEIVHRHTGPPGPLLAARAPGLDEEELVVIRALAMLKSRLPGTP